MSISSLPSRQPCQYYVEVTRSRRVHTRGWRVQVTDAAGVSQLTGSLWPWRAIGVWRATREDALRVGVSAACELPACTGLTGPLVVWADGAPVIDERPETGPSPEVRALTRDPERAQTAAADANTEPVAIVNIVRLGADL